MTVLAEKVNIPNLPYSWTGNWGLSRSIPNGIPFNKKLGVITSMNYKPSELIAKGVTAIQSYSTNPAHPGYLPPNNRAVFLNQEVFKNHVGGSKPLEQFTKEEITGAINSAIGQNYGIVTTGWAEPQYDNDPWCIVNWFTQNPYTRNPQVGWMVEALGAIQAARPEQCIILDYGGAIEANQDSSGIQAALLGGPQACYNYCASHPSLQQPYFAQEMWRHIDCSINQYYRTALDLHKRIGELHITIEVVSKALEWVKTNWGFDRRLMLFCFFNCTEILGKMGWVPRWYRKVGNNNGTVYKHHFPTWGAGMHQIWANAGFDKCHVLFLWEDTLIHGWDPNLIMPDYYREYDNYPMELYTGGNAPRGTKGSNYDPNIARPYPGRNSGFEDFAYVAAEQYRMQVDWCGAETAWARYRFPGGNWVSMNADYVYQRAVNDEPFVRLTLNGAKTRGWIKIERGGGSRRFTIEVDILGNQSEIKSFTCEKNMSNIWRLTIN